MLQRRSFPRAPSQQQVLGIHAKQILIINIAPNVTRSSCLTRQGNLLFLFIYFFYTYPHAFRVFNDTVMCQSKVSSKADTNIPPHTDGEDPIANKNSRAPRIEKKLLDNNQWLARAHVFNLQEILPVTHLHCFLCFFFCDSETWLFKLWEEDLTLSAGAADIATPEVIVIHSQSQITAVLSKQEPSRPAGSPVLLWLSRQVLRPGGGNFSITALAVSRWQQHYLGRSDAHQSGW